MRAAIYVRQSLSNDEGIDRQRARCQALIEARGWQFVREYVDNDVSASKPRGPGTAWHSLLNSDDAQVVVAVNLDRVVRAQRDLTALIDSGMVLTTLEGELDLASASGELQASILTSMARFEARRKGERQQRANLYRRTMGLPSGSRRSFGYTPLTSTAGYGTRQDAQGNVWPDFGHEPHPVEAPAIRRGYALLLSGHSIRSIARAWNSEGLLTTSKEPTPWSASSVRAVLANPKYAGLSSPPRDPGIGAGGFYLSLKADDLTPGKWEPIVSEDTWRAGRDLLADQNRRTTPGPMPMTLLSGIARCAVCGATVRAGATRYGVLTYRCSQHDHMARNRGYADEFITHVVLDRLARPDVAQSLLSRQEGPDIDQVKRDLRAARKGEEHVLALVSQGLTSMAKATDALKDVRERVANLESQLNAAGRVSAAMELLTEVGGRNYTERWNSIARLWQDASIDRQRAVVRSLVDITMAAPRKGSRPPKDEAGRLAHTEQTFTLVWR